MIGGYYQSALQKADSTVPVYPSLAFDLNPHKGAVVEAGKLAGITDQAAGLIGTVPVRPTYSVRTGSRLPVLGFSANEYIEFGDVLDVDTSSITIYVVGKSNLNYGSFISKSIGSSAQNRYGVIYDNGGLVGLWHDTAYSGAVTTQAHGSREILVQTVNRSTKANTLYRNGTNRRSVSITQDSNYNFNSTYRLLVGGYNDASGTGLHPGYMLRGEIDRILVYRQAHDAATVADMTQALNKIYKVY